MGALARSVVCAVLVCATAFCGGSAEGPAESAFEAVHDTDATLTTPTGATLVVLPRPAVRTTRMFADAYVAPFIAAGWGASATPTAAGTLDVTLQTAWSAYGIGIDWSEAKYSGASQTELTFAFNAGATVDAGIASLAIFVDDDDATTPERWIALKPYLTSGAVAASTWYRVAIPMSVLNPTGLPIRRVLVGNRSSLTNVKFFVDDLAMSWTDDAPAIRDVYQDTGLTGFGVEGWSRTTVSDAYRTTGDAALKTTYTAAWGALTFVYDWNQAPFPANAFSAVSFDVSPGVGAPAPAMNDMRIGLDSDPKTRLLPLVPGGFKANTWHRVTIPIAQLTSTPFRMVAFKNESASTYSFFVDNVRFETYRAAPPLRAAPSAPSDFAAGEVDVVTNVKTAEERRPISPLIYGINGNQSEAAPADVLRGVTFVRRGGDRCNAYNWETNASNGSHNNGFVNDMWLTGHLASPNAPGELDRALIAGNRAGNRGTMVPFVMNDYAAGPLGGIGAWNTTTWNVGQYFKKVELVKPTPFSATPDPNDGVVYTDEHIAFLKNEFAEDIFAPDAKQVMVGTDNEPDLYAYNFPMVQRGGGKALYADSGVEIGRQVTGAEFTAKYVKFAKRVKSLWPNAPIVGPDHYHFDGFSTWWDSMSGSTYYGLGRWYMDDFLETVRNESVAAATRLLDTWDFHWYPQRIFNGTFTWALDNAARTLTPAEIDAVVQGPRSYWDTEYDEQSWITQDHLLGPAYIVTRLQNRIAAGYPGTKLGVTEYFPGGCSHVSSALATADSLGVFARMGVHIAALWPHACNLGFAYGGFKLVRNADGNGLAFAATNVKVEHPEKAQSSVFAGNDDPSRVTMLVINKTNAVRRFGIRAFHSALLTHVDAYRVDASHPSPFLASSEALSKTNAYAYAAPPMSATLLVLRTQ